MDQDPKIGTTRKERNGTDANAPTVPVTVLYVDEKGEVTLL